MIFPGTDKKSYRKASVGKTRKERSKIYYRNKRESETNGAMKSLLSDFFKWLFSSPSKKVKTEKPKEDKKRKRNFVPKEIILDNIRDYRSSTIVSHISNKFATFLAKNSRQNLTNSQSNFLRSTIALIVSETLNKALEKPLKIIDKIEMYIKAGKIVYKVYMFFDNLINEYRIDENHITTIRHNDFKYIGYLKKHPKIKEINKRNEIIDYLGKNVLVIIDRPIGSVHHLYEDVVYKVNYGYIINTVAADGEEQDAYVLGINEPLDKFDGVVKAIIHRKNDNEDKLIVCPNNTNFSEKEILEQVDFQEKYFDAEVIQ